MIRAYRDDANICFAVGDPFGALIGTADSNRRPAVGVSEQVSFVTKSLIVDYVAFYDGTNQVDLLTGAVRTDNDLADVTQVPVPPWNMAWIINNTTYLRKTGTTDRVGIAGVEVA